MKKLLHFEEEVTDQFTYARQQIVGLTWKLEEAQCNEASARLSEAEYLQRAEQAEAKLTEAIDYDPYTIIAAIIKDIRSRSGIRHEWDEIDVDVRNEIVAAWRKLFPTNIQGPKGQKDDGNN